MKTLISNEVARYQSASLRIKLFHTSSFMYFAFIFSECITNASSKEGLKVCECNFFQRKVVLLEFYLFNHDASKSTIFMLSMAFEVLLSAVFVKLGSFVSCDIKLFALCFHMYFFYLKLIILFYCDKNFLLYRQIFLREENFAVLSLS